MHFVVLKGIKKHFGDTRIFADIDLTIDRGEICVLVGPSGCGKTTLLRAIAGLVPPDSGSIHIDGVDVANLPPQKRGIAMVFQHYALFPNMTVEQNLAFGLEQLELDRKTINLRVGNMLELMGLNDRAKAKPAQISGGQKQRVALARALVTEPKLLLLDEPMSALDAQIRKRLREDLKRLQAEIGFTAIFVTHDQEEALVLGDKIAVMQDGRLLQVGTPIDVYNRPASRAVANFIGDFNIVEADMFNRLFALPVTCAQAIHPESIRVLMPAALPPERAGRVQSSGTVTALRMLGSVIRYRLDLMGQTLQADVLNRPDIRPFSPGAKVVVLIDQNNLRPLPS